MKTLDFHTKQHDKKIMLIEEPHANTCLNIINSKLALETSIRTKSKTKQSRLKQVEFTSIDIKQ